jgi:hypothetical protein
VLGGGGGRWSSEVAEAPPWPRVADGVGRGGVELWAWRRWRHRHRRKKTYRGHTR